MSFHQGIGTPLAAWNRRLRPGRSGSGAVPIAALVGILGTACQPPPDVLAGLEPRTEPVAVHADPAPAGAATIQPARIEAPSTWVARPPTSTMRIAEWGLPGGAECALFAFAGGGSVDANVRRWIDQFEQTDGTAPAERAERESLTVDGVSAEIVRVRGTFLSRGATMDGPVEAKPDWALFGVVYLTDPTMHFLKCVGPAAALDGEAESLSRAARSFRVR
ncbi:MAG: hypothetical protein H6698_06730 [Myxococcales bacterium]|nr:hypothetical protein [Myxococcales bacterium]MCB9531880.1 hypothetical protein [Myxococcales bacterium]MCB9534002.1 hypothetical protein [Myxococcales bacterium]